MIHFLWGPEGQEGALALGGSMPSENVHIFLFNLQES